MDFSKIFENGTSGWIVSALTLLLGGGSLFFYFRRRRIKQIDIHSDKNIVGGNYVKGNIKLNKEKGTKIEADIVTQKNIRAKGNVVGGDFIENDK